jgi:hypothetical protein
MRFLAAWRCQRRAKLGSNAGGDEVGQAQLRDACRIARLGVDGALVIAHLELACRPGATPFLRSSSS